MKIHTLSFGCNYLITIPNSVNAIYLFKNRIQLLICAEKNTDFGDKTKRKKNNKK